MLIHPVTLIGRVVRLEPLLLAHVPDMAEVGLEESIWSYMRYGPVETEEQMCAWVSELLDLQDKGTDLPFAVISLEDGRAIG